MIPYSKQSINSEDILAVTKVLKSDFLTTGPKVLEFEKNLAKYCNRKYALAVSNGTSALHLAYLATGLGKGDEVITTPNTFVATTNMLLVIGARPVFCDIRLDNYNIDENQIEKLITKKTKAIVPVHFSGHPCAMDKIRQLAKKYNLLIIDDVAHALGAKYKNQMAGGFKTDISTLSFHPVKSITTGEGGAVLTDNRAFFEKAKLLRSQGIIKDKNGFNVMLELGYNYRLNDIGATLGNSQLKKLNGFIKKRRSLATLYNKKLKNIDLIILPKVLPSNHSAHHLYVIRTKKKSDRMPLYKFLLQNDIGVNFHYPNIYKHPYYKKNGFKDTHLTNAEIYSQTAISIPLHQLLKTNEMDYIVRKIKEYFS